MEAVVGVSEVTVVPTLLLESLASLLFPSCCSVSVTMPVASRPPSLLLLASAVSSGELRSAEVIELPLLLQEGVMMAAKLYETQLALQEQKRNEKL